MLFLLTFFLVGSGTLHASQRIVVPLPPVEDFSQNLREDRPQEFYDGTYGWRTPWGYDRPENANRSYPLVVIGSHGEAHAQFTDEIRKRYPAFFIWFGKASQADGENLSDRIDTRMQVNGYRIDLNRIYLTGWSAGGSGGYNTIRGFLNKGKCFAAFIRIAGQSNHELPEGAIDKIAISMHIGLGDSPLRVKVSRDLYAYLRDHPANESAVETVINDTEFGRTIWVLSMDGAEIIRYHEYDEMKHTYEEPYADPALFEWLMTRAIGTPSNTPPTLSSPGDQNVQAGNTVTLTIEASDPDGDTLTYSATGQQQ